MFAAFMEAIEKDKSRTSKAHARSSGGHSQHRTHPPAAALNAHTKSEPGADWLQVLSQNAHLVNLEPEIQNSGRGFGFSELGYGPSMFYKPTRFFEVNALPGHPF
jgi:hypothetical protein